MVSGMNKQQALDHYAYLMLKELTDPKYHHLYEEGKYDFPDGPTEVFKIIHDTYSEQRKLANGKYNKFETSEDFWLITDKHSDFMVVAAYLSHLCVQQNTTYTELLQRKSDIDPDLFEGKIKLLKRQQLLSYIDELIETLND